MFYDDFEDVKLTLPVGTQPPRPRMQFNKPLDVKRYDYLFKLIVIGDQSVGKTNLTMKFCEFGFDPTYVATIGKLIILTIKLLYLKPLKISI